jgi:hypothetical protein
MSRPEVTRIGLCNGQGKLFIENAYLKNKHANGTSEKDSQTCRYNGEIYFHCYKILGLLYKRALFDLQFVHNLFWLKLKWNARSKLFYCEWLKLNVNVLSGNFISLLSVDIERHGRNESCWPKWPENINWPSGPIFVQFDWPDRKYTGLKRQIKTLLLYHLSFLHALMKFKDIDKIKVAISETL